MPKRAVLAPPETAADRRRFLRAPVMLRGRLIDAAEHEHAFTTMNVSSGGALIALAGFEPIVGHNLVLYLDELGRIPARVVRLAGENIYGVEFAVTPMKRERIAETLTFLLNARRLGLASSENRRVARFPGGGKIQIRIDDGRTIEGEIVDFSLVGLAVKCAIKPPKIGQWVQCGHAFGRVARYIPDGFAVDFEPRSQR
jgi:hypothetical protein